MALLRHLFCGLVVYCLIMPVNAQQDPHEFRCPVEMGDKHCSLTLAEQPHNIASNAIKLPPLMVLTHCAEKSNTEFSAAGGDWFTFETCKMLMHYSKYKSLSRDKQRAEYAIYKNLYDQLECTSTGWQTGDNCRWIQRNGTCINTLLHKDKGSGKAEIIMRDIKDLASDTILKNTPEYVMVKAQELHNMISGDTTAPKEAVVDDAPKTVHKTITEIPTVLTKRGTYKAQGNAAFHFFVLGFGFVCWCICNNPPYKNGWIVSFLGLAWVPCISNTIMCIDEAQTATLSIRDKLMITRQHGQMPTVQDSRHEHRNRVYRSAAASPHFGWYRSYVFIAFYFGVTWSNTILYYVCWMLLLDMKDASGWTGPVNRMPPPVQPPTTTFYDLTWYRKIGYCVCGILKFLYWILQALSNVRYMDSEFWQKLKPRLEGYLIKVTYIAMCGMGFYDLGFFEWKIFLIASVLCNPLLYFLHYPLWIVGQVQEGVSEQVIEKLYTKLTEPEYVDKTFVVLCFAIQGWSLSLVWKDMLSARRSGSVSLVTYCVLMLNVFVIINSVYFADMKISKDTERFQRFIWSQFYNLAGTPFWETLILVWWDVPDYSAWAWGYPYRIMQSMSFELMTSVPLVIGILGFIQIHSVRDPGEKIRIQLWKCGENMWEFAFKGAFVTAKLPLLYVCIFWYMLSICTCQVENTGAKELMKFGDCFRDRTIVSKIQVPRVVYTWMQIMICISVVHVLFANVWGKWGKQWTHLHSYTINSTHHSSGNRDKINHTTGCTIHQIYTVLIAPTVDVTDFFKTPICGGCLLMFLECFMSTESLIVGLLVFLCATWNTLDVKTEFKNVPCQDAVSDPMLLEYSCFPPANMGTTGHWRLARTIFIQTETGKVTVSPEDSKNVFYLFRREGLCDGDIVAIRVEQRGCAVRTYAFQPAEASDICE